MNVDELVRKAREEVERNPHEPTGPATTRYRIDLLRWLADALEAARAENKRLIDHREAVERLLRQVVEPVPMDDFLAWERRNAAIRAYLRAREREEGRWSKERHLRQKVADAILRNAIGTSAVVDVDALRWVMNEIDNLRGAMVADDERLRNAETAVWGEPKWGCNAPSQLADAVLSLRARIESVKELHSPYGIYDECSHTWREGVDWHTPEAHGGNEPVELADIGLTCKDGLLYTVCHECHTDDGEVHEHTDEGSYPCATLKALGVKG